MAMRNNSTNVVPFSQQRTIDAANAVNQKAFCIGIVAGLRSMMPLALLAWSKERSAETPATFGNMSTLQRLAGLAAVGEIIADKLPAAPSRLASGPFVGRLAMGAIAGAMISRRYNQPAIPGAVKGAIGAGFGAIAGYSVRMLLAQTILSDIPIAIVEDGIALSLGLQAVKKSDEL
jgi:uncharacterized membrane protein